MLKHSISAAIDFHEFREQLTINGYNTLNARTETLEVIVSNGQAIMKSGQKIVAEAPFVPYEDIDAWYLSYIKGMDLDNIVFNKKIDKKLDLYFDRF